MRVPRCRAILISVASLTCSGCFSGFEQPPRAAPNARKARPAAASQPAGAASQGQPPAQSYAEAWRLICEAEQRADVDPALDRAARGAAVADWIVRELTNKQARYWFIAFGKVKHDRRGAFLAEAARAGQPRCALADLLFERPTGAPPP